MKHIKNMLYAGLGIGNTVSEKSYDVYNNFIDIGKKTDSTITSALENFFESLDNQSQDVKDTVFDTFQLIADKLGYVKLNDYETLQKRIKTLEADLAKVKSK